MRHRQLSLAGRTLDLVTAPELITNDTLIAGRTGKFEFCHKAKVLSQPVTVSEAGISFNLYRALDKLAVKEMPMLG